MQKGAKRHLERLKSRSAPTPDPWWLRKLRDEPFKVVSVGALTFGGLMLILFFANLGEWPDLDLKSSAGLLWALAAIGGTLTVFLLLIPALPGAYVKSEPIAWRSTLPHVLWLSAPAAAAIAWLLVSVAVDVSPTAPRYPIWGLLCGVFLIAFDARLGELTRNRVDSVNDPPSKAALLVDMLVGSTAWLFTLGLTFVFAVALYSPEQFDGWKQVFVIAAQLAFTYIAALAVSRLDWSKEKFGLLMLTVATIVLPAIASKNISAIGVAAVRALGLGDRPVRLVVSAAGCDVLNKATGKAVCQVQDGDSRAVVCPAILKSRIGKPYFVELSPIGEDQRWPERKRHPLIPLAGGDVLSWPRLDLSGQVGGPQLSSSAGSASAEHSPATVAGASSPVSTAGASTNHESAHAEKVSAVSSSPDAKQEPFPKPYLTYLDQQGLSPILRRWLKRECDSRTSQR